MNEDTLFCIFEYLSFGNIRNCSIACKLWNIAAKSDRLWKPIFIYQYGNKCTNNYYANYKICYKLNRFFNKILKMRIGDPFRITSLNIEKNKWPSYVSVPREFGLLTVLQHLRFQNCCFGFMPSEVFSLINLQSLAFLHCGLYSISSEISKLTNLYRLNLSRNEIMEIPKEIGYLTKLQSLRMEDNKLKTIPEELSVLPLTEIDISKNASICISDLILKVTNLQTLDMALRSLKNKI
jgi:Leucine-rich repeat (LRR) protein